MTWRVGEQVLSRVLVTRLRYLGDIVMSTVVLSALRRGDPRLEIGYLCEQAHAPVLAGQPELARVHALSSRRRGDDARARTAVADGGGSVRARGTAGLVAELRAARYDAAVDLFFNPRSAWLLWLSGIPLRLAGPAGGRRRLYTHASQPGDPGAAGLERLAPGGLGDHLCRLAPLVHVESGLPFGAWFLQEDVRAVPRLAPRAGAVPPPLAATGPPEGFVVLAPAATWATKRWPVEHWRELAGLVADRWPGFVAVLTVGGDEAQSASIAAAVPGGRGVALPPLPLATVLDVLGAARAVISVDGGVMHAAVGLGVPTLGLFGPTDPRVWFPYGDGGPFRVLARRPTCHPCDLHDCGAFVCLPELAPRDVAAAALALLATAPAAPPGAP